ncbi:MAG: hypothetical protein MUE69_09405 [Myxococcota bacterium]|jgi:hypothetical protein|nr:hypothetical protein [Myxococcota bacterium]
MRARSIALFGLIAATFYWSPALYHLDETGFGDWQTFVHQWEATRAGLFRHGELALWNPWHCGGTLLWGDPQAQGFGPLFWLTIVPFGSALGGKLFLLIHGAIGFSGMFVASRRLLGVGPPAAIGASILWAGSGFFAWHGSGGHSAFLPFYFTPWLLLFWRLAPRDSRYAVATAFVLALTLWEGGVYPFPYFALLLAFDGAVQLARASGPDRRSQRIAIVRAGVLVLPLALLLGAWRLVPSLLTMSRYPRPTFESDRLSIDEVIAMLTSKDYDYGFPGHEYVWAEYGTFIGWTALLVALAGAPLAWRRGHRWVVLGVLFFGATMMGRVTPLHPWSLLHHLPVFGSLRVPSRFAVLTTFYLGLSAAFAIEWLRARLAEKRATRAHALVPALLLVGMGAHLYWGNAAVIDRWRELAPPAIDPDPEYFLTSGGEYHAYASFPARGVSTRGCYTGMTFEAARGLWEGRREQARVPGGRLIAMTRTANTITLEVERDGDAPIVINQTWAVGWSSDVGRVVQGASGLIEVHDVPAGRHVITLRFFPDELPLTVGLTLAGFAMAGVVLVVARRRRRALGG